MLRYRRTIKISLTDMVTNEEVLERMSERRTLKSSIRKRSNEWIGCVMRLRGLLGLIIENCVKAKSSRKRLRMDYMKQIIKDQWCNSYEKIKRGK